MVARGKTSADSLFYHISQSCKCQQMKIKRRYFVPKVINIGLDLLELFEHITGVLNFLRHSAVVEIVVVVVVVVVVVAAAAAAAAAVVVVVVVVIYFITKLAKTQSYLIYTSQEAQLLLGDRATRKHAKELKWTWK